VILLSVIETPPAWVMEHDSFQESHEAQKKIAKEYLSKIQSQFNMEGVKVTSEVSVGSAAETIIDFAKQKKVDLILMTTNVSSEISQLLIDEVVKVETAGGLTLELGTTEAMSGEKEEEPVSQVAKKLMVVKAFPDGSA